MKLHIIRTKYPHWGKYSGYNQFLKYVTTKPTIESIPYEKSGDTQKLHAFIPQHTLKKKPLWYAMPDYIGEIKSSLQNPDLIHYLDGDHTTFMLPLIKEKLNTKIVATYHQPKKILRKIISKDVIKKLDHIILVSASQKEVFAKYVPDDKISVILHGVNTEQYKPSDTKEEKSKSTKTCLIIGSWLRDWETIQQITTNMPEVTFVIISTSSSVPKGPNIMIYKDITDDVYLKILHKADILLMPLLDSTANNGILEGIACGLPVITTDLESTKEYLNNDCALFCKTHSEYVDAIRKLSKNKKKRVEMGKASRKRALELDWKKSTKQIENIYSEILDIPKDEPIEDIFDWKRYLQLYPELTQQGINTKKEAILHWNKTGAKEGKIFTKIGEYEQMQEQFDWEAYIISYPEIWYQHIRTKEAAIKHYLEKGRKEGKKFHKKSAITTIKKSLLLPKRIAGRIINNDL